MRKIYSYLLLTLFLSIGLNAWGDDLNVDFESATGSYADWTFTNFASKLTNSGVTPHGGSYFGTTGGKATGSLVTNETISSPESITFYVSKQTTNTSASNWYVKVSTDGTNWTTVGSAQDAKSMSKGVWVEVIRDLSSYSDVYVGIFYDGSTAVRCIDDVTLTYSTGVNPAVATTTTIDASGITNTNKFISTAAGSLSAVVKVGEDAIDGATVTWSSSAEEVATIDEDGVVTLVAAGSTVITASYAGIQDQYKSSSDTYNLVVTNDDPNAITVWSEDFGEDYTAHSTSFSYDLVNGGSTTQIYPNDNLAGGVAPELLVSKSNGYFEATIPLDNMEGDMKLSYKVNNNNLTVSSSTEGVSVSAPSTVGSTRTLTISGITTSMTSLNIRFSNAASGNTRLDDIVLKGSQGQPKVLSSIALSGTYPTTFHVGDAFSHEGIVVTATYDDESNKVVTASAEFSTPDMTSAGEKTITVSYTENEVEKTTSYTITVNAAAEVTSIALSGTYPTEFEQGDDFSHEGIVVTAYYSDETSSVVTEDAEFTGYDMSTLGEHTVIVSYEDKTQTYTITIVEQRGTENNPYTVAQAIAATPASGTSSNVYIKGIVSKFYNTSIVGDGSNYRYYISDDGTTTGQLLVYKGKGLNNVAFSDADDLLVGDTVVILGGLTTYNSTKEVASGNYLISLGRPVDTTPSIDLASYTLNVSADEGLDGTIEVTYNNITNVAAEVYFCNAAGTEPATYDWLTASINGANNISYSIQQNTGAARTAYLKVYALDDEANDVYSDILTITQAAPVVDYATLPFEFNGGSADIETTNGLTQNGLGSDYTSGTPKSNLKFDTTGDELILKFNDVASLLTFYIKGNSFSGGTFTVQVSANGTDYDNIATYKSIAGSDTQMQLNIDLDVRYIKWIYTEKSSGNVGLGNITLENINAHRINIGEAGYATYYNYQTAYTMPTGLTGYVFNVTNGLEEEYAATAVVPKGIALVLGGAEGSYDLDFTTGGTAPAHTNNLFGSNHESQIYSSSDYYYYGLSLNQAGDAISVGFYWMEENGAAFINGAHKAYLKIEKSNFQEGAPARFFVFNSENNATSLEELGASDETVKFMQDGKLFIIREGVVYDAMGKMVK